GSWGTCRLDGSFRHWAACFAFSPPLGEDLAAGVGFFDAGGEGLAEDGGEAQADAYGRAVGFGFEGADDHVQSVAGAGHGDVELAQVFAALAGALRGVGGFQGGDLSADRLGGAAVDADDGAGGRGTLDQDGPT